MNQDLAFELGCWGVEMEEEDVDITGTNCTTDSLSKIKTGEDPDATERSSSFDGTLSAKDNCSQTSDADVESRFYGQEIDSFESLFPVRKKKLTAHWKNFIRPLMWRSKWAELKINELQKQARKYDRELTAYEAKKKLLINEQQTSPDFGSKLSPFKRKTAVTTTMRRRRRRRVEDVTDIKSYFSKHNLFSYHENDKSNLDGSFMSEEETDYPEKKINVGGEGEVMNRNDDDCWLFPEWEEEEEEEEESNNPLEQFMRKILNAKSHVEKLKSELASVISGGDKANKEEKLGILIQYDARSSSSEDGLSDETNSSGGGMILYGLEYDDNMGMEDRGEVSRYSSIVVVPDIIESNVSKLSSVDVTMHHQLPQSGDSNSEAIMDNGHIHSREAMEERRSNNEEEEEEEKESGQEQSSNSSGGGGGGGAAAAAAKCDINEEVEEGGSRTNTILLSKGKRGKRNAGSAGWKNMLLL
ncbi:uncharacterized protein LOC124915644 [Impatiens glandulifera]|uniref:uncharacterized protein LOC124915644 n=1 Tax=Impatiens glandulifera TaxID=253017 RepID=UPI001FB124A9|nr:uncharacterized protein LOC124915644 [Impatiens glandulifera]